MNRAPAAPSSHRLAELAPAERPQERLERLGPDKLSNSELLAMLLRSGSRGRDVLAVADELLNRAGTVASLLDWSAADFLAIHGIGKVKALQLVAVTALARRMLLERAGEAPTLSSSEAAFHYLRPITTGLAVEKFWVLILNRRNKLLKCVEITSGTATASLVHPREVFREAIRHNATAILCAHNHPSGDPTPSRADIEITRRIHDAARTLGIDLLDHVIMGRPDGAQPGFYSFTDAGLLA